MNKQSCLHYFILLILLNITGALAAAENNNGTLSVTTEDIDVIEAGTISREIVPEKIANTPTTKEKRHSIKMIVGGQSTGGVAKQITLPVDD